jgi:hypothetical protein
MFEVFPIMRDLHELLWYLTEALTLQPAHPLSETERLTHKSPDALRELDIAAHRRDVNALLQRVSELVRAEVRHKKKDYRGADLTESLFLTQSQRDAAKGDTETKLPPSLTRRTHWYGVEDQRYSG